MLVAGRGRIADLPLFGTKATLLAYFWTRRSGSYILILTMFMIFLRPALSLRRSRPQDRVTMSMQPRPWPEVPADTAGRPEGVPEGALAIRARDELGSWHDDEAFGSAYGCGGAGNLAGAAGDDDGQSRAALPALERPVGDLSDRTTPCWPVVRRRLQAAPRHHVAAPSLRNGCLSEQDSPCPGLGAPWRGQG
jgi:hypothetical protein